MSSQYIEPIIVQARTIEDIEQYLINSSKAWWEYYPDKGALANNYTTIDFTSLKNFHRLIILGEPGCGKSELLKQILKDDTIKTNVINLAIKSIDEIETDKYENYDLICFDALDEVEAYLFSNYVRTISLIEKSNPKVKIFITCRTYYIKNNRLVIKALLSDFEYAIIDKFDDDRIYSYLKDKIRDEIKINALKEKLSNDKGKQLNSILKIPRYLSEICDVIINDKLTESEIIIWKRADFFDRAIYRNLETEIKKNKNTVPNELELSKRILEKLALIMEIKRVNKLTIDELITFLDDINSNINLAFLSGVKIDDFITRVLKKTGEYVEFHNTEFQEYLASKELCRFKSIDQVLYDLIVDNDFLQIYDNWYDVLRFVVELKPEILIPLSDFLGSKKNGLADEQLLKLLEQIDISLLNKEQKSVLFERYYSYFQSHEIYIHGKDTFLTDLFVNSEKFFFGVIEDNKKVGYHFRIHNQFKIVSNLINQQKISENLVQKWRTIFYDYAITDNEEHLQKAAIYALMDTNDEENLILLDGKETIGKKEEVFKIYLSALDKVCPNNEISIRLFIIGLKLGYKEAIYGLMSITDFKKFVDVYKIIIKDNDLFNKFFHREHIYEYSLFALAIKDLWNDDKNVDINDLKEITETILYKLIFDEHHHHIYHNNDLIKSLLFVIREKNKDFIFDLIKKTTDIWIVFHEVWILQILIVENQLALIKQIVDDKKSYIKGTEFCLRILRGIKGDIQANNPYKNEVYEEGRKLFPSEYEQWESPNLEINEKETEKIIKIKELVRDVKLTDINRCFFVFDKIIKLGKDDINKLDKESIEIIKGIILSILDFIKLDNTTVVRKSRNEFTITNYIVFFNECILLGIDIGLREYIQTNYRAKLIYFLPFGLSFFLRNNRENNLSLVDLIGTLSQQEEIKLLNDLSLRTDDYINMHISEFLKSIKELRLSSFLDFIKKIIDNSKDESYNGIQAVELLKEDFITIDEEYLLSTFRRKPIEQISRNTVPEKANQILISKFNNIDAVKWRFDFLKSHIYKFDLYDFVGTRGVSSEEIEMDKPTFCNCFIESKRTDYTKQFLDLIEFSLTINTERDIHKYSTYLQNMSLGYFKALDDKRNILEISKLVKNHSNKLAVEKFLPQLREIELYFVNKQENINVQTAVDTYNKLKAKQYITINNTRELYYVVKNAVDDLRNKIENEGLYQPIQDLNSEKHLNEDLIQKTLKIALENSLYKLGIRSVDIIREANLYDNKRTDLLIKYDYP